MEFDRFDEDGNLVTDAEYWKRRAEWSEENITKDVAKIDKELQKGYNKVLQDIEQDIADFMIKNQHLGDINKPVTIKEYLTSMDKLFRDLESAKNNDRLPIFIKKKLEEQQKSMIVLQNARLKRTRLNVLEQEIKGKIALHGADMHEQVQDGLHDVFINSYDRKQYTIQRGVGYGYAYATPDFKLIDKAIMTPWAKDGSMFSQRIWDYVEQDSEAFVEAVRQSIASDMFTRGIHPKRVAKNIVGFGNPRLKKSTLHYNSTRLLYTEASHIMGEAEAEVSMDWGMTHYFYLSTLDDRTSSVCQGLDGQRFEYKKRQAGVNFPPMHPCCRSTTYDDIPDNLYDKRSYRDKTGKTLTDIPHTVTYPQWKKWQDTGIKTWDEKPKKTKKLKKGQKRVFKPEDGFVEVSNIKDASLFAEQVLGIPKVDYSGFDVTSANEWNRGLYDNINQFPQLKERFGFTGGCHARNTYIRKLYTEYVEQELQGLHPTLMGEQLAYHVKKNVDTTMRKMAISKHTMAQSWSPSHKVFKHGRGITLNKNFAKDSAGLKHILKRDMNSKFHPVGCDSIRSILDHEVGHQLDDLLGIRKMKHIQDLYNDRTFEEIENGLSKYCYDHNNSDTYSEMIAEGWAEFQNNPNPREMARVIGKTIVEEYDKKFGGK